MIDGDVSAYSESLDQLLAKYLSSNLPESMYLHGSVFQLTDFPTSDVDVFICYVEDVSSDMSVVSNIKKIQSDFFSLTARRLDARLVDLSKLKAKSTSMNKSIKIYGNDVFSQLGVESQQDYLVRMANFAMTLIARFYGKEDGQVCYPLSYPDCSEMYYGYKINLSGNFFNMRPMYSMCAFIAASLLAIRWGLLSNSKVNAYQTYCEVMNDEWCNYLLKVSDLSRRHGSYLVESTPQTNKELRYLFKWLLPFLNHFLTVLAAYVSKLESASGDVFDLRSYESSSPSIKVDHLWPC